MKFRPKRYFSVIALSLVVAMAMTGAIQAKEKNNRETKPAAVQENAKAVEEAKQKLQASYAKLSVTDFRESPVAGIYSMIAGGRVIYFVPEKDVLIFGEMYSKDGRSLTQEYLQEQQAKKIALIPLSDAIVIGKGKKKVIEFTDPDCPFCQRLQSYLKSKESDITRYVFFSPLRQLHPDAAQKVVHILCAENKEEAFNEIYSGKVAPAALKHCEAGEKLLAKHETISSQFGVSGTPTLVVENSVITGFQEARIAQFLNQP